MAQETGLILGGIWRGARDLTAHSPMMFRHLLDDYCDPFSYAVAGTDEGECQFFH